jgi:hypothetical protein
MMAFVNTAGVRIPIWLSSENPKIGWGVSPDFPLQEGTFFGNVMMTGDLGTIGMSGTVGPKAYFCAGADFMSSVVAGRLSASVIDTVYMEPFGPGTKCANGQTVAGPTSPGMTVPDGFKRACVPLGACFDNGETITVWRNAVYTPMFDSVYRYVLTAMSSGRVIDLASGSTANGTPVQQFGNLGLDRQKFAILKSGTSSNWQLATRLDTKKCIGPVGNGTDNATRIEVQDCNGSGSQAWTITVAARTAAFTLKNVASGRCLEVPSGVTTDGAPLQLFDCTNGNNQRFTLSPSY